MICLLLTELAAQRTLRYKLLRNFGASCSSVHTCFLNHAAKVVRPIIISTYVTYSSKSCPNWRTLKHIARHSLSPDVVQRLKQLHWNPEETKSSPSGHPFPPSCFSPTRWGALAVSAGLVQCCLRTIAPGLEKWLISSCRISIGIVYMLLIDHVARTI